MALLPPERFVVSELPPVPSAGEDEPVPDEQPTLTIITRASTGDAVIGIAESANLEVMYSNCRNVGIFVPKKS